MSDKQHVYPADDFDKPEQGPVGLHRGPRSFGARALPYLIVIIVAVLCGLGVFVWLSGTDLLPGSGSSSSVSQSAEASESASASQTESPSESASSSDTTSASPSEGESSSADASPSESTSPSESASPEATVDRSSTVTVLNGTRTSGLASRRAATLTSAGYTSVGTGNANRGSLPSTSTVWYRDASDLATAQDVAAQLGISQVAQSQNIDTQITVVLMQ
ncbi:LytR C-terminal domain-containing protein [Bifidobacterium tissieri]|uniref:LytR family transcriptional regulator n=1 Tax=Bifidobacterium tissieri TaxID=1630162 RepID=A0A5M9ZZG5_9BIFI|nr:LytR C-terminal domain-containing protein [Bifidobacterium tissieri]KAA8830274.1 LytR family transcriptional regulator [Bifidobacterium tissieri]KAA8833007.1 LytR family transcriptional regulator [Bifidobacterium tissieri]